MQVLILIGVLLFLFISNPIANAIQIEMTGTFSLIILSLVSFNYFRKEIKSNLLHFYKTEMIIILLGLIIIITKFVMGDYDKGPRQVLFFLFAPMFISALFKYKKSNMQSYIRSSVLSFFVIECIIAIYEKIMHVNLFVFENENEFAINQINQFEFRSTSLLGHPLMNALIVSMILGYIIISNINIKLQLFLVSIGFLSLLSFNGRGAILIWMFFLIFFLFNILRRNKYNKLFAISLITLFVSVFVYFGNYLLKQGFGGRLFNNKLIDGSALARVDAFNAFSFINSNDFIFGNSFNYIIVMEKMGAAGIENSFIVVMMNFGVIFAIPLFIAYYFWIKESLVLFKGRSKYIIIVSFLILGLSNNGLATYSPWIFFVLCNYSFKPEYYNKNIRQISI